MTNTASHHSLYSHKRTSLLLLLLVVFFLIVVVGSSFIQVCGVVFLTLESHLPSVMLFKVLVLTTKPSKIHNLRAR